MPNLTTYALVVIITLMGLTGSFNAKVGSIGALLAVGSLIYLIRKAEERSEIGLPDQESSIGPALEDFLAREAVETPENPEPQRGIVGRTARYLSKRAQGERDATVAEDLGRGLYRLAIKNSRGEIVSVNRRRENFRLA